MTTQHADYNTWDRPRQADSCETPDIEKKRKLDKEFKSWSDWLQTPPGRQYYEEYGAWCDWLETPAGQQWIDRMEAILTPL